MFLFWAMTLISWSEKSQGFEETKERSLTPGRVAIVSKRW